MNLESVNLREYKYYHNFYLELVMRDCGNAVLNFLDIPYTIESDIRNQLLNFESDILRMNFSAKVSDGKRKLSLIVEFQSTAPTEDDFYRLENDMCKLFVHERTDVEVYIVCKEKVNFKEKTMRINDNSQIQMNVISLKDFKASEIFNNIENKLKNNNVITDEDIASLQLVAYTDYDESTYEILIRARKLLEIIEDEVSLTLEEYEDFEFDINEKTSIIYLFDVLSANMLEDEMKEEYYGDVEMRLNPKEEYLINKTTYETLTDVANSMLNDGFPIEKVVELTKLPREDILNSK